MSLVQIPLVVQSPGSGAAISGAQVTVTTAVAGVPTTTAASLYEDSAGVTGIGSNVYYTDMYGRAYYAGGPIWIPTGEYAFAVLIPGIGSYTVVRELANAQKAKNDLHAFAWDDQTIPNIAATILGTKGVYPAPGETVTLLGAQIVCASTGGTPTEFAIMYDHGAHGTLSTVPGLGMLVPATGAMVFTAATGGPLPLAQGDQIALKRLNIGTSEGCSIEYITQSTF